MDPRIFVCLQYPFRMVYLFSFCKTVQPQRCIYSVVVEIFVLIDFVPLTSVASHFEDPYIYSPAENRFKLTPLNIS